MVGCLQLVVFGVGFVGIVWLCFRLLGGCCECDVCFGVVCLGWFNWLRCVFRYWFWRFVALLGDFFEDGVRLVV